MWSLRGNELWGETEDLSPRRWDIPFGHTHYSAFADQWHYDSQLNVSCRASYNLIASCNMQPDTNVKFSYQSERITNEDFIEQVLS